MMKNQKNSVTIIYSYLLFAAKLLWAESLYINEFLASNVSNNLDPYYGQFSDWIEIYNAEDHVVNVAGYYLTDDLDHPKKWQIPAGTIINPQDYYLFWADSEDRGAHTNFKLSFDSEEIGLANRDGVLIDSIQYDCQISDVSYGRQDSSGTWLYFSEPTPKKINDTPGFETCDLANPPHFSHAGGFYNGSVTLSLSSNSETALIRYTRDGSKPVHTSQKYAAPIKIDSTTVIRAKVFDTATLPSPTMTHTFFIDESISLPIISIATTPKHLWDENIGIYVKGIYYNGENWSGNFYNDWEKPIHVEFYDVAGLLKFDRCAGMKIYGGTRFLPQKSLAIYTSHKYGTDEINYPLFHDKPISTYKSFVLRNSSQDYNKTKFRDAFMHTLVKKHMDIDYQSYCPVVVFLNGAYWGIHNMREKLNEDYLASNHDVEPESVDLLGENMVVSEGDSLHYAAMIQFMSANDMKVPKNYAYIQTQMDIHEFINYQISEIYFANTDWPATNIKYWRPRTETGKWRWLLYDTDYGFGRMESPQHNTLEFASASDSEDWRNAPWATFLLRTLLQNSEFKHEFIQRFAAHINYTFEPRRVVGLIDSLMAERAAEMPRHIERWGDVPAYYGNVTSVEEWEQNVDVMRTFAHERPDVVRQHIQEKFNLDGTAELTVRIAEPGAGKVLIHTVPVSDSCSSGQFFKDMPISLKAVPHTGHSFTGWMGDITTEDDSISISLSKATSIRAVFDGKYPIVINEIHYDPSYVQGDDDNYEFLELYNSGNSNIELSNFSFTKGIYFNFPQHSFIAPQEYIVLSANKCFYDGQGYQVFQYCDCKLSNDGEVIQLEDANGHIVDYVKYGNSGVWPTEPNGTGPSLELIDHSSDNSRAQNWKASELPGGTPGRRNVYIRKTKIFQNYPNPFESRTTIPFDLQRAAFIQLDILNIRGQFITTLLNDYYDAGHHHVVWDCTDHNLSSGVYLIKLEAGGDIVTKKMVVLK